MVSFIRIEPRTKSMVLTRSFVQSIFDVNRRCLPSNPLDLRQRASNLHSFTIPARELTLIAQCKKETRGKHFLPAAGSRECKKSIVSLFLDVYMISQHSTRHRHTSNSIAPRLCFVSIYTFRPWMFARRFTNWTENALIKGPCLHGLGISRRTNTKGGWSVSTGVVIVFEYFRYM